NGFEQIQVALPGRRARDAADIAKGHRKRPLPGWRVRSHHRAYGETRAGDRGDDPRVLAAGVKNAPGHPDAADPIEQFVPQIRPSLTRPPNAVFVRGSWKQTFSIFIRRC